MSDHDLIQLRHEERHLVNWLRLYNTSTDANFRKWFAKDKTEISKRLRYICGLLERKL